MRYLSVRALVAAAVLGVAPLPAQDHQNQKRGLEMPTAYAVGDLDSINLWNGNLTLSIPLGITYPVGGGLSLSFGAHYNSTVWNFSEGPFCAPPGPTQSSFANPDVNSTAGLGWVVSLGRLLPPNLPIYNESNNNYVLIEPDGTRRIFFQRLHEHDTTEPQNDNFLYTRDSSMLRFFNPTTGDRIVESPNGVRRFFNRTNGWLKRIEDRYGNSVVIDMSDPLLWVITDSSCPQCQTPRRHEIGFRNYSFDIARLNGGSQQVTTYSIPQIDFMRVASWDGGTATYDFQYLEDAGDSPSIQRHLKHTADFQGCPNPSPQTARAPILQRIVQPDGTSFEVDTFVDNEGPPPEENPSGAIKSIVTPLLGKYDWRYQRWNFMQCFGGPNSDHFFASNDGVLTRTLSSVVLNSPPAATWTYTTDPQRPAWLPGIPQGQECSERRRQVTDALGNVTMHYFFNTYGFWQRGLPFSPVVDDGGLPDERFLSKQLFQKCTGGGCQTVSLANLKRTEWVRFTADPGGEGEAVENQRLQEHKTVFEDDGDRFLLRRNSAHDGLGHYRTTEITSDLDSLGLRRETTNFNSANGVYNMDPDTGLPLSGHNFSMVPTTSAWILETYNFQQQEEGGVTAKQVFEFDLDASDGDPPTGFLRSLRKLRAGTNQASNDHLAVYCKSSTGFVEKEIYYGGEGAVHQIPGTPTCASPGTYQYRIDHTYRSGSRETSQYIRPNGQAMPFKSFDASGIDPVTQLQGIDENTGLVSHERDPSLYRTRYSYDPRGRRTQIAPVGNSSSEAGPIVEYFYNAATASNGTRIEAIVSCPSSSDCEAPGATEVGQHAWFLDGFGRLWRERKTDTFGINSKTRREFRYNELGWKTQASEWQNDVNPTHWTIFAGFDVFGRPATVTPPDGSSHNVSLSYTGTRVASRTTKVDTVLGQPGTQETNATVTETYDRYGRLLKVVEPAAGVNDTNYAYDVGGRLKQVQQIDGGTTQTRAFTYNNYGTLQSENHPEKGGPVQYPETDSRGHVTRLQDGSTARVVTFEFNPAEQLVEAWDESTTPIKPLKEFTIGTTGNALGKIEVAKAWTHVLLPPPAPPNTYDQYQVTESYVYGDRERRPTQRTTALLKNDVAQETFIQGWDYNGAGEVATLTYPRCSAGAVCQGGGDPIRTQALEYNYGFLKRVPNWANSISYHRTGMVDTVAHTNTTTYVATADTSGLARPSLLELRDSDGAAIWNSGAISYDGSGNVREMGSDWFAYDLVSRLVQSRLTLPPSGAVRTQDYLFDGFGNITRITTDGAQVNTPTSSATNRLNGAGVTYDAGGNLLTWNGNAYVYDLLNRMVRYTTATQEAWHYAYTADDERLFQVSPTVNRKVWTLRDLDGRLLTRMEWAAGGTLEPGGESLSRWSAPSGLMTLIFADGFENGTTSAWTLSSGIVPRKLTWYAWRDDKLLGAEDWPIPYRRFFALDHLGTVRAVTSDAIGDLVAEHEYFPFGQEATSASQDAEITKFTGHERDLLATPGQTSDDLDYMHARHTAPLVARFVSVDKVASWKPATPQTWNRFVYALNNPVKYLDSTGLSPKKYSISWARNWRHVIDRHVRHDINQTASKFESEKSARELIAATVAKPDKVDVQVDDGRLLLQKAFESPTGTRGEMIVRVVGKPVGDTKLEGTTGFPAFSFKNILSLLPGLIGGALFAEDVVKEAATASGDAVEKAVLASEVHEKVVEQEKLANDIAREE